MCTEDTEAQLQLIPHSIQSQFGLVFVCLLVLLWTSAD